VHIRVKLLEIYMSMALLCWVFGWHRSIYGIGRSHSAQAWIAYFPIGFCSMNVLDQCTRVCMYR
jgi:hypothetical protein